LSQPCNVAQTFITIKRRAPHPNPENPSQTKRSEAERVKDRNNRSYRQVKLGFHGFLQRVSCASIMRSAESVTYNDDPL
jgi:hypothetical protein